MAAQNSKSNQKLDYDYLEVVRGVFGALRQSTSGMQSFSKDERVSAKMNELVEITKKIARISNKEELNKVATVKMISKDYVAYSVVEDQITLAGAVKSLTGPILWPLLRVEEKEMSLSESKDGVEKLLQNREGVDLKVDIETMNGLDGTYRSVMKNYVPEKIVRPQVNLANHKQISTEIKFGKNSADHKF